MTTYVHYCPIVPNRTNGLIGKSAPVLPLSHLPPPPSRSPSQIHCLDILEVIMFSITCLDKFWGHVSLNPCGSELNRHRLHP
jgi:hypothetical protein